MSGKLIVFEGTDGSGKATQAKLLCRRLERQDVPFWEIDFPRYGAPSAAMVEEYLSGALGKNPGDVNAYAASTFYAIDRYASYKQDWGPFYEGGGLVIANRYTTSNAVHQASKLPQAEREAYLKWLFDFEYRLLGLPEPALVVYLDLPTELSGQMMRHREQQTGTQADIHENNEAYLRACRENARQIARDLGWRVIQCASGGRVRSAEDIQDEVYREVQRFL
ncbi:thymidylate kinase [Oscillibacter hominis]|uniref:Thymidylate kinase n=1 Tax=Oscillibacter hominis TaxID=2763056 RepID=A0A7G9B7W5_9FIRM|nr:thymidylate kinase [Oscillibacter hominis]QNL45646.1 thymidylate kinase [Oscillibacter hominis]